MNLKICIVSEAIKRPFDEGVKIFVYNLIKELAKDHTVLGLSRSDDFAGEIEEYCSKTLPPNRLFISPYLRRKIREFDPDIIYYIPTACVTISALLRAKVLSLYGKGAKMVMITLQPREYSAIQKKIIHFLAPDLILAQSGKTQKVLNSLGLRVKKIASGVDLQKFTPVDKKVKENLRKKHGFPDNKYIILHVGHINRNRNTQFMERIQSMDDTQVIVVGSTSYPEDSDLVKNLQRKGVITITSYIRDIEEIYQCADCYLFPVLSDGACIEVPLSVFEAMACNLPVVSTKFGGLPNLVSEREGFFYADTMDEIISRINSVKSISDPGSHSVATRKLVEHYSWASLAKQVLLDSEAYQETSTAKQT